MAEELMLCPLRSDRVCADVKCAWWTTWDDKGMCCVKRIVQFINKKDISNAEKERLRSMMEKEWHG